MWRRVREWAGSVGYGTRMLTDQHQDHALFTIVITLLNGTKIIVERPKKADRYILAKADVTVPKLDADRLAKMHEQQQLRVMQDVVFEIAKTGVPFDLKGPPLRQGAVTKRVPISEFTENAFHNLMDEMSSAAIVLRQAMVNSIEKHTGMPLALELATGP
jgi:hypothetical protein